MPFTLSSPDFPSQGTIPTEYTCMGKNISPQLKWKDAPSHTMSFAIVIVDPDAPRGDFIHWVIFNIPANTSSLPQNVSSQPTLDNGILQGVNDFGRIGYGGPCPPQGEKHSYVFTIYALDKLLPLHSKASYRELQHEIKGHILGEARLVGFFSK